MTSKDEVLWDDVAFRARVEAACKARGLHPRDVFVAAGTSRYYFNKPVAGRSTDAILKIARQLGVPPGELAFGPAAGTPDEKLEDEVLAEVAASEGLDISGHFDAESLRRLIATMFTAQQVMALLYLALNQKEANLDTVASLILKAAHGGPRSSATQESTSESAANSESRSDAVGMGYIK